MSTQPYAPRPVEPVSRPKYTSLIAVLLGLALGKLLTFLLLPVFTAPILAGAWIYLMLRVYRKNDILTNTFKAPHHKEITFRAAGIAIANPLANLLAIPTIFFVSEGTYGILTFIIWVVLAVSAERFALHLHKKHGA